MQSPNMAEAEFKLRATVDTTDNSNFKNRIPLKRRSQPDKIASQHYKTDTNRNGERICGNEAVYERCDFRRESKNVTGSDDGKMFGCEQAKMADRISHLARQPEVGREVFRGLAPEMYNEANGRWGRREVKKVNGIFLLLRIVSYWRFIFMASIFILLSVGCQGYQEQRFAMEPQDQTAIIGSRVTLPCRVVGKSGQLQWTKDDFGLGTHRNLSGYDRYSMIGSDEEGDYSLDIAAITLDDDAKYQCQVSSGPNGEPGIRSRYASLSVLVPPEPPKIVQGSYVTTTEDKKIQLECISVGGKPAAEITWIDGNGGVLSQGLKYIVEPLSDGRRFTARSILHLTPRREHHNQTFTCQAQNTADRTYRAARINIEVKYAPKVRVSIVSGALSSGRIPEGAEIKIGCHADANPDDLTYKWFLNDEPVIGDYTTEMIIFNVTRKYHDSIVKCEVHNSVGKSEESETLDVSYGPKFRLRPSSLDAETGSTVTLSCDVDGNPAPEVIWFHQEQDRTTRVGRTSNLTLTVDKSSAGRYICKAKVEGYPEIESDAMLFVKGPPKIISAHTQLGISGDNVRVECIATSVPKPDRVVWMYRGHEIALHDQDYAFLEDSLPEGIKSTLIIRESQSKHFGVYNCSVYNEYGSDFAEIHLKAQKTFPLVLILFGVTSGIIVIAAFTMLVVLCQRKRRKRETISKKPDVMADLGNANGGHCKESDRSSNISDLKMELRQADGGCEMEYVCGDGKGLPLAGPVSLPGDNLHYRYSNDYSDPAYTGLHFKEGHNNNGYVPYSDYARDFIPPTAHELSSSRIQLTSLHSTNHLNQLNALNSANNSLNNSLTRSTDTASTARLCANMSQNNSLQRTNDSTNALNSLGLPITSDGLPSPMFISQHGSIQKNGGILAANGIDVRYAATYGNPYLRSTAGLGGVHTANPAATPAPPPYSRHSTAVSSPGNMPSTLPSAQPQVARSSSLLAPQSPSSQYILPPTTQASAQVVQLTKKGNCNTSSLATHV